MSTIGPIALFGSGETSSVAQRIHQRVMELLPPPICPAILETPAGFEPNAAGVAKKIIDYLDHRLQNFRPDSISIPARKRGTAHSPDDPQIAAPLLKSNYIFMGPGSPTYVVRQLCDSYTWHAMLARHRMGAALCFSSASTIAVSQYAMPIYEIYKVGEELHWKQGLDFFGHFGLSVVLVPHWNNKDGGEELDTSHCYLGKDRYDRLLTILPNPTTILGIEENTGLVIQPEQGTCEVVGIGGVVLVRNGVETRYNAEEIFKVKSLGNWQLPTGHTGIPKQVWEDAHAAAERMTNTPHEVTPPEIVALAEARTQARSSKDWAAADRIREELAEQGWQVKDTPDGPKLMRIERS